MTEIREPNYSLDLPGEWNRVESDEPGVVAYHAADGSARVTVTLLSVRAMFTIADPHGMLTDYLHHRPQFEKGRDPGLEQSAPTDWTEDGVHLGEWSAYNPTSGRRMAHRVRLADNLLADFVYEETGSDVDEFSDRADVVLSSATATA